MRGLASHFVTANWASVISAATRRVAVAAPASASRALLWALVMLSAAFFFLLSNCVYCFVVGIDSNRSSI